MTRKFARFIFLRLMGWSISEELPSEKKAIFLAAPHTSLYDFVIGYLYFRSCGAKPRIMIKKEAFSPPLGWLLKALGGFPIDRKNPTSVIHSLLEAANSSKEGFYLVMCPEGTRKAVRKWKTGYHTIAVGSGCPVYLGHYDYKTKVAGCGPVFKLGGNAREDTDRIQEIYRGMNLHALHPEGYTTE